jgi:hypothetical protein
MIHWKNDLPYVNGVLASYDQLVAEVQRLQRSIHDCSTEEGLCYGVELQRKDAEIARLRNEASRLRHPDTTGR